jgi:hypothetical protein
VRVLTPASVPCLLCLHTPYTQTRLEQDIQYKQALREQVAQQLEGDMQRFKDMEREAAALISKARHANSKLMVS